jgi:hypothetical protein
MVLDERAAVARIVAAESEVTELRLQIEDLKIKLDAPYVATEHDAAIIEVRIVNLREPLWADYLGEYTTLIQSSVRLSISVAKKSF